MKIPFSTFLELRGLAQFQEGSTEDPLHTVAWRDG